MPRAVVCDPCFRQQGQSRSGEGARHRSVIPHKANERDKPAFFAKTLYKARSRIRWGIGRLKRFKRVALRCEKTARNFRSIVSFAAGLCLIKLVTPPRALWLVVIVAVLALLRSWNCIPPLLVMVASPALLPSQKLVVPLLVMVALPAVAVPPVQPQPGKWDETSISPPALTS